MALERDNCGFQSRFYLVGTGVVRIPGYGKFHRSAASFQREEDHYAASRKAGARTAAGSSGLLFRVFGHVKSAVVTRHRT